MNPIKMRRVISIEPQNNFLGVPTTNGDVVDAFPGERSPQNRDIRPDSLHTKLASPFDFDPLKDNTSNKDLPIVVIDNSNDYVERINTNNGRPRVHGPVAMDTMPHVCIDGARIDSQQFQNFKTKPKARRCFPITAKEKGSKTQIIASKSRDNQAKTRTILKCVPGVQVVDAEQEHHESVEEMMRQETAKRELQNTSNMKVQGRDEQRPTSPSEGVRREESRLMKQRHRLLSLQQEVDGMEREVKERETRLLNWQDKLDAQELSLQEREAVVSRHNRHLSQTQLTELCEELDRNKEELKAQGLGGRVVAKLNWSFLRQTIINKQFALEAALRNYKADLMLKDKKLRECQANLDLCQSKVYTLETEVERRGRRICQLEHIITVAMRNHKRRTSPIRSHSPSPTPPSTRTTPSPTPKIVINDCSNVTLPPITQNAASSASIDTTTLTDSTPSPSISRLPTSNERVVKEEPTVPPPSPPPPPPRMDVFKEEKFVSQTCSVM